MVALNRLDTNAQPLSSPSDRAPDVLAELAARLPAWHLQAACRAEDPSLFFLERGHDYAEARKICATCPVFDECLEYAVAENLNNGIFAGMSAKNRRQVAKGQAEPAQAVL